MKMLTPNTLTFIGGLIMIAVSRYMLAGTDMQTGGMMAGFAAMTWALKSPGQLMEERKGKSVPPPSAP